ncbi:hypothetical protein OG874_34310 [Nocardia sp. NBC_00565]|uniref:hypothetical protein n=1 Tax=Nocardia sp. NBC_00565 TaxID=2975993 RepID=UPI002E80E0F9|nr:hypothetical protein [Nocardia sp. NBC_00565]WUC01794.1 hypothetical protein OG874_34310 [Nocardia sp. NBC_00565]
MDQEYAMRFRPTAFAWIDLDASPAPEWDRAQTCRLARRLGYTLIWPPEVSLVSLVDQVRAADVDAVIVPSLEHLDALVLHALMGIADVEAIVPRMSFARWATVPPTTRLV